MIKGIVGWTDLTSEDVDKNIKRLKNLSDRKLVGIRHLIQLEQDPDWLIQPNVLRGLACLESNELAFDCSCNPIHLKHVPFLADRFPKINFIIDHMAKVKINGDLASWNGTWFENMKNAAKYPNVFCKLYIYNNKFLLL